MIKAKQVASVSLVSVISTDLYADVASSSQIKLKCPLGWNNPALVLSQLEIGSFFTSKLLLVFLLHETWFLRQHMQCFRCHSEAGCVSDQSTHLQTDRSVLIQGSVCFWIYIVRDVIQNYPG